MLDLLVTLVRDVLAAAVSMLNSASPWIIFSFAIAGVIHEFITADKMEKTSVGSTRFTGLLWGTGTGFCLPICSCGTIPLGISMYYSGAYLGPVLTFMTACPMINPIALILAFGLLGPQIAIIYLIVGLVGPIIIGMIGNKFAGDELYYKPAYEQQRMKLNLQSEKPPVMQRVRQGMKWAFSDQAITISKYTVSGMLIAGLLFAIVPQSTIQQYLGNPTMVSLLGITIIAAAMYVCAVGHIPFIAAIVASGAAPGIAITFLMAGCATNIAELLSIGKIIGKRAALLYSGCVIVLAEIGGMAANLLLPNFTPVLNYDAITHSISNANKLMITFPDWLSYLCTAVLFGYACVALVRYVKKKVADERAA